MTLRRIVTGHDAAGRSVFADVAEMRLKAAAHLPGFASKLLWATPPGAAVPDQATDWRAGQTSFHPEPGGSRFLVVTFPPDSVMLDDGFDPVAAGEEQLLLSPGIAERFEADNPGMHRTDSIDYGVVPDGEIWLDLDDGETMHLRPHDCIIQTGNRHAWRNRSSTAATLAFVLVGATRGGA